MSRACKTCLWWDSQTDMFAMRARPPGEPTGYLGACHAHPPAVFRTDDGRVEAYFPATHESRFCRLWEAREAPTADSNVIALERAA